MTETLSAVMEETIFRNEENGYSVITVRAGRDEVTVVGTLPALSAGEQVVFAGAWTEHPQYGKQWKATTCEITKPTTMLGIERFLSSGLITTVGPATAKLIVEQFGLKTLDIISEHPERLVEVRGIGNKRAAAIADSFREQYAAREVMVFLQSYGVTPSLSVKIANCYGERAVSVVKQNPYKLIDDIEGVGFLTADRIALSLGVREDSEYRLRAGIKYVLTEAANAAGHTYLPNEVLNERAAYMLRVPQDTIAVLLQSLLLSRELIFTDLDGVEAVCLPPFHYTEIEIAARLHALMNASQTSIPQAIDQKIADFERTHDIAFSANQRRAVSEAISSGLMIITGGPGTGKTTIINCIIDLLGERVLLAAPTGRAAKRMTEATGHEAKTIHRLLEYTGDAEAFQRNEERPLDCDCVIVDEMSMVDIFLMRALLRAVVKGTRLILVGDADQLPSVGAGNVLGDMLASGVVPSVRLTDIFRQESQSLIVQNAHSINHGDLPVLNRRDSDFFFERKLRAEEAAETVVALCSRRLPAFLKSDDPVRDIQPLSPTKKGACGVYQLNRLLQAALNPPDSRKKQTLYRDTVFREGDKVMHVRNNYQLEWRTDAGEEGAGVFNGDIGFITAVDNDEHIVSVCYDEERYVDYTFQQLEELELAYCLSVHKSQGGEFPCVVMPVVGGPPMLLTRNLFYTALTRARKLVVLVGQEKYIADMVRNDHIATRFTALKKRLLETC